MAERSFALRRVASTELQPCSWLAERPILLFYDGYEEKAVPGPLGRLYSNSRRTARHVWKTVRGRQTKTGFYRRSWA